MDSCGLFEIESHSFGMEIDSLRFNLWGSEDVEED